MKLNAEERVEKSIVNSWTEEEKGVEAKRSNGKEVENGRIHPEKTGDKAWNEAAKGEKAACHWCCESWYLKMARNLTP